MKTANILLFDDWKAKVADFGLSLICTISDETDYVIDYASGTSGYLDPVYQKSRFLTKESDIYSLGVVLFEILYGKSTYEIKQRENKFLHSLVQQRLEEGRLDEVVFNAIKNQIVPEALATFQSIAYQCLHDDREKRPTAQHVLVELQKALELQDENDASEGELDDTVENDALEGESKEADKNTSSNAWKVNKFEHLRIGLVDILLATENFSKKYDYGSPFDYCKYYYTNLECFDREYNFSLEGKNKGELPKRDYGVTIKCINRNDKFYNEDMFYKEIEILGTCMHENIDRLLGFCDEGGHMIIVYEQIVEFEFLPQILKSLFLTWEIRLKICLDIAHGLNYMHNEMEDQKMVIHRKIHSGIIVWDVIRCRAIITEFELSTFLPYDQVEDVEDVEHRKYIAPEYSDTRKATKESDIYSFGLVMFDILCEMRCQKLMREKGKYVAQRWLKEGIIKQKMARAIREENFDNKKFLKKGPNEESLDTFIKITEQCLAVNPEQRPTLQVIIQELEKALLFHENHKDPLRMSFEDIKLATQNFSRANDIGGGGFGRVYKGELASEHGSSTIVAKRLDTRLGQGDQQFYNELHILSEYKHENVIGLVGYNNDEQERIIVYEFASKGSLDNYLNDASLTWINRLNICVDVARGLAFLHGGVQEHEAVIHRDMKTANILLFDYWRAKVADFGLSLICTISDETDYVIDYASGTPGYLDPAYQKSRFLTKESDIYSLGVVLFEILYGKSTYEIKKRENQFLQSLVKQRFEKGRLDEVVFNAIKNQIVPEALATFQAIAYRCLHDDREKRPTTQDVLVQLQKALILQVRGLTGLQGILEMAGNP